MRLSDFVRQRRKELKYTQKQLATEVGQNSGWVCMVESGLRQPGDVTIPMLSAALEVPEYLIRALAGHSPVSEYRDDLTISQLDAAIKEFVDKVGARY